MSLIKIPGITDVFFDLDHTLWDFDKNSALAFQAIFKRYAFKISFSEFIKVYEPINLSYWKQYQNGVINKTRLRRGRFQDAFACFGLYFSTQEIDTLAQHYIEALPENNFLFEGTIKMLEDFSTRYNLHIITNGFEEVQHIKLEKSNIKPFFKTITTSEAAGVKKPNKKIFLHAMEVASTKAKQSVMIGDTYDADVLGAANVGMQTIFFNYRKESVKSTQRAVTKISELKHHL